VKRLACLDTPLATLAVTGTAFLALVLAQLGNHGWDASFFVTAGERLVDRERAAPELSILPGSAGYDGQFYYRLALDPWTSVQVEHGVKLDSPAYRQQRIGYPLLVWALAFGQHGCVPAVLIGVNWVALCVLGWLGGCFARDSGRHALWGLLISMFPGFELVLVRDLTEIVATTFLLGGFWLLRADRGRSGVLAFTAAVLTRETAAAGIAASALAEAASAWRRGASPFRRASLLAVPLFVLLAWQGLLFMRWGTWPAPAAALNFAMPLVDLARFLRVTAAFDTQVHRIWFLELLLVGVFVAAVIHALPSSRARPREKLAWLLYLGLSTLYSGVIWVEDWAFLRALSELWVTGAVVLLGSAARSRYLLLPAVLALWLVVLWRILHAV
jgi:hypothetical protein